MRDDIKYSDIKELDGHKFRFSFRENGYVLLDKVGTIDNKTSWVNLFHATNLESCLQCLYKEMNCKIPIIYEELKEAV